MTRIIQALLAWAYELNGAFWRVSRLGCEGRTLKRWNVFEDLDTLRQALLIPTVNTGEKRYLTGPSGIVADDSEGLHACQTEAGTLHLVSGTEFQDFLYRGQTGEKLPCVPTIGRILKPEERLLALCRKAAFEEALEAHPLVRQAIKAGIFVDIDGLTQHYGLATDMLDLTASFAVASFFATCRWDAKSGGYLPVGDDAPPGVIYRVRPAILEDRQPDSFHLVGWQPLPRPEQQRAFAVRMKRGQDFVDEMFTTERAYFKQNSAISYRIWKEFDEGRALFPDDPAAQVSQVAKSFTEFTEAQIACAWSQFEAWEGEQYLHKKRRELEVACGITVGVVSLVDWSECGVETHEDRLNGLIQDVLNRVRFRRATYL